MQVQTVTVDRAKARQLYRAYKIHQNYQRPEDYEIMRAYQLIAQGKVIIQAIESIRQAGLNSDNMPKLPLCRANAKWCYFRSDQWGHGHFSPQPYPQSNSRQTIKFTRGLFPQSLRVCNSWDNAKAAVPIIPIHLRPQRGIENYHILWEATWELTPPVDPYLLRRIRNGDMWLVVAAWDLTEVERAAMRTRMMVA
jgi:hypothetical protein